VKATEGATVTVIFSEWKIVPLVPVIVTVKIVPAGTPAKKITKDVLELPPTVITTGLGTNITVTPAGTGLLERVTLPVKVPILATVRTSDADDPAGIERDDVAAVMLKSEMVVIVRFAHVPVNGLLLASPL
jgi:hypothetical protein